MTIQKKAFTLVELIVSVTIIAILASIGFYSYVGYLSDARDAERKASAGEIKTALQLYKQKRGAYPFPGNNFNIVNSGALVGIQGRMDTNVTLSTMDKIPLDPYTNTTYFYSITKNKQEYQIALTLENGEFPIALLEGDYKTVSKNVLPSIILAINTATGSNIEIKDGIGNGTTNRNLFILDLGLNLPYTMSEPYDAFYAGENIDNTLANGNINFWQNTDYRNCTEITEAAKLIHTAGSEEYQIVDISGVLSNTGCLLP